MFGGDAIQRMVITKMITQKFGIKKWERVIITKKDEKLLLNIDGIETVAELTAGEFESFMETFGGGITEVKLDITKKKIELIINPGKENEQTHTI